MTGTVDATSNQPLYHGWGITVVEPYALSEEFCHIYHGSRMHFVADENI